MNKKILVARIRQILATDKNAFNLYSDLASTVEEASLRKKFSGIAKDEKRHCLLGKKMLLLLEK